MRTTLLALLALSCSPESHQLLVASPPDGGPAVDSGSASEEPSPYTCFDGEHHDTHGTPCSGTAGCSSAVGAAYSSWCVEGEHVTVRGSFDRGELSPACESDAVELLGGRVVIEPDGTCFDVYRCDGLDAGLHLRWCQASARTTLRADAVSTPWTDCPSALVGARDGDPCVSALSCAGNHPTGPSGYIELYLWCDEGITRIAPGMALTHGV